MLTGPHMNRLGCFVLDPLYMAADVQIKPVQAETILQEFEADGRILRDRDMRLVLVRRHLKHNVFENPNVARAAARDVEELPYALSIFHELLGGVEKYGTPETESGKPFYSLVSDSLVRRIGDGKMQKSNPPDQLDLNPSERVTQTLSKGLPKPLPQPFRIPEPEPDPLPEPTTSFATQTGEARVENSGKPDPSEVVEELTRSVSLPGKLTPHQVLMPLTRELFYVPDGKPPPGYDSRRDGSVIRGLVKAAVSVETLEAACRGAAYARDAGLEGLNPGEKLTWRRLLKGAESDPVQQLSKFAHIWRKQEAKIA